ncbi:CPBP family intramembrane metalloprotease [Spirulina sp. CS-785/01]|uniref:CPBP family intramembrane glutamic endopeptidase n=1 Tax=Spirulina sp. CS-785/01 TaxID=3021716 RepID=UPI00232C08C6|nr:CPBP family intramembrane glutamic endopeptidase [Spirulina sp. CS-785/01]MDB9313012.1 CPBP family intramembrane metalloprotease [Spirulina sp. CS-785/01]
MTLKRVVLIILTVVAIARVGLSLGASLSQPQVQSRLELYQTNLVLHAAEYNPPEEESGETVAIENFLGNTPYQTAQTKYENARQEAQNSRDQLQAQLTPQKHPSGGEVALEDTLEAAQQQLQLEQAIAQTSDYIENIDLKIGLLQVEQGKTEKAKETWQTATKNSQSVPVKQTAQVLKDLWKSSPTVNIEAETVLKDNLDGWFQFRALSRFYEVVQRPEALAQLQEQEQQTAEKALLKLGILAIIPSLGALLGVGLLIGLGVQWVLKRQDSILASNGDLTWETPWNWEITWQVLVVGFFVFSQVLLPLFLPLVTQLAGVDISSMGLRGKAGYILLSYLLMTGGGLAILYFSIKEFLPLPDDWFRFKLRSNWFIWGFGGYVVAVPLVLLISLLNQQIWQGQGGGNPIILLALQAQDKVALLIFFTTACVAAPVFEEIIFRGFFLPSLTRYIPLWGAISISAVVFAVAHLSLSEVLPLTVLGLILGFVYTRSRNLLAPILLHSLWNSGTLLSLFLLGSG